MALFAVFLLAVLVYTSALGAPFFWDDRVALERQLRYLSSPLAAFFPPPNVPEFSLSYYRPIVVLSWQLDELLVRLLFGDNSTGARELIFHASNVLLHALTSVAVVLFAGRLLRPGVGDRADTRQGGTAIIAGVLFAIHPLHAEPVVWMSGRSELWMGLFATLALLAAVFAMDGSRRWLGGTALLLLLSLLSKETAVGTIPALAAIAALRAGDRQRRVALGASCVAALLVYVVLRSAAAIDVGGGPTGFSAVPAALAAIGWSIGKLLLPWPPTLFEQVRPGGAFLVVGLITLVGMTAVWLRTQRLIVRVGLAWLAGGLLAAALPAVTAVSRTPIAERYTYLATGGVALLLAAIWQGSRSRPTLRTVLAAAVGAACLMALIPRIALWRDPVALWTRAAQQQPQLPLPLVQLGRALDQDGRLDAAERAYQQALELASRDHVALALAANNLGSLQGRRGDLESAIVAFRRAVELDLQNPYAPLNLARALIDAPPASRDLAQRLAQLDEAERLLQRAASLAPRSAEPHALLGQLFAMRERNSEAVTELERALALDPDGPASRPWRQLLQQLSPRPPG